MVEDDFYHALRAAPPQPGLFEGEDTALETARSILRPQRDKQFGFGYALSPYRGCEHGCGYCYVRSYPQRLPGAGCDQKGTVDNALWGKWAVPKLNAAELLWRERHRLHNQSVFLATATDPYQPLEREYRLTRACLEVLLQCWTTTVLVHTRSPLILQDLDLLKAFGSRLSVGFSVPTDDDTLRQVVEPKAPPIPSRWAAIERLTSAGVAVHLAVTPLLPMVDPHAFARRAQQSGVSSAWVGGLRLLDQDPFYAILEKHQALHALDPLYQAEVRDILHKRLPASGHQKNRRERSLPRAIALNTPLYKD